MQPFISLALFLTLFVCGTASMKCAQCAEANLTSRVYPHGGCSSTLAACSSYFDEQGNYVHHACNTCSCSYRCSRGHTWTDSHKC